MALLIFLGFFAVILLAQRIERWRTERRHVRMFKAALEDELRRRAFWQ